MRYRSRWWGYHSVGVGPGVGRSTRLFRVLPARRCVLSPSFQVSTRDRIPGAENYCLVCALSFTRAEIPLITLAVDVTMGDAVEALKDQARVSWTVPDPGRLALPPSYEHMTCIVVIHCCREEGENTL